MLKWIKVRDSSTTISKNNAGPEVQANAKEEEDDSGMEREDSPAVDLSLLKKVGTNFKESFITFTSCNLWV